LETVFGEILPVANLSDIVGIGQFILNRFLSNPDILAQFAHPTGIFKLALN
jgi:abnormal spindle-like microcephaly-associated protein